MKTDARQQGYTLIEVMVTIVIFSLIAVIIFSSYQAFLSSGKSIKAAIDIEQKTRIVFKRMQEDLQKIYVLQPPGYSVPEFSDEPDPYRLAGYQENIGGVMFSRLIFASFAKVRTGRHQTGGVRQITYYIRQNSNDTFDLCRSDLPAGTEEEPDPCRDPVLVKDVLNFEIAYFDDQEGEKSEWDSDSSDDSYTFPGRINMKFMIAEQERTGKFETAFYLPVSREKSD